MRNLIFSLIILILLDMGFTRVYDFGGIIDWPYLTVGE